MSGALRLYSSKSLIGSIKALRSQGATGAGIKALTDAGIKARRCSYQGSIKALTPQGAADAAAAARRARGFPGGKRPGHGHQKVLIRQSQATGLFPIRQSKAKALFPEGKCPNLTWVIKAINSGAPVRLERCNGRCKAEIVHVLMLHLKVRDHCSHQQALDGKKKCQNYVDSIHY